MKTTALPIGILTLLSAVAADGLSISAAILIALIEIFAIKYLYKSVK